MPGRPIGLQKITPFEVVLIMLSSSTFQVGMTNKSTGTTIPWHLFIFGSGVGTRTSHTISVDPEKFGSGVGTRTSHTISVDPENVRIKRL
jgi:hypothetical protein